MIEVIGVLFLCYLLIGLEAIVPGGILGILGFFGLFLQLISPNKHLADGLPLDNFSWGWIGCTNFGFHGV